MASPQWITNSGSLGIAVELEPYTFDLLVQTGDARASFAVIAGHLPPGLSLTPQGNIAGFPIGKVGGVPLAVNEEIEFKFVVRCTNERGELSDRTFAITVTGQDPPQPRPAPYTGQSLGVFNDGSWIDIDISAFDPDPDDQLTYTLIGGELPSGITLDDSGHITGYADPAVFALSVSRYDTTGYDVESFDQGNILDTRTYKFDVQVSDNKNPVIVGYSITLVKTTVISADTDAFTSDYTINNTVVNGYVPVLSDRSDYIDTITDQNYYYHQFESRNFDPDAIVRYEMLPIVRYPSIVGSVRNPAISIGTSFSINGIEIPIPALSRMVVLDVPYSNTIIVDNITDLTVGMRIQGTGIPAATTLDEITTIVDIIVPDLVVLSNGVTLVGGQTVLFGYADVYTLVDDINENAIIHQELAPISASVVNKQLYIYTTAPLIELQNITGTPLSELGISEFIHRRNTRDVTLTPSADLGQLVPPGLTLNSTTGWLHGYVQALPVGRKDYDFFIRVYDLKTEPSEVVAVTDYAVELPFNDVNGKTQSQLDALYIDAPNTDFDGKTIVFVKQDGFASSDAIVWNNGSLIPGYDQKKASPTTTQNQRAGVWTFSKSGGVYNLVFTRENFINEAVVAHSYTPADTSEYVQFDSRLKYAYPDEWNDSTKYYIGNLVVYASQIYRCVADTNAAESPDTHPAKFTTSVPWYSAEQAINPLSSVWPKRLTVTSSFNYQLNWITSGDLGTISSGMPCKLQVQAATDANSIIEYQVVATNPKEVVGNYSNSTVIRLDNVSDISAGMRLIGSGLTGQPVILNVFPKSQQVQLSSAQTLLNGSTISVLGTDLPRGLQLTSAGELQGRPSHQHWRLDDSTTFDDSSTSFDRQYIVNIQATTSINDPDIRSISSVKTFVFTVIDYKNLPSNNLFLDFLLEPAERSILSTAIYNDLLVPDEHVYRPTDHWFGRQQHLRMLVANGIDPIDDWDMAAAIANFHHNKNYTFVELRWAQSTDADGNPDYEVIYIHPLDDFTTSTGIQFSGNLVTVTTNTTATSLHDADSLISSADSQLLTADLETILPVTPGSLANMRTQLVDQISPFNREFLPTWMTSRQPDKRILNFIPAIPLVYLKPGYGKRALFKLQQVLDMSTIQAVADRYVWDDGLLLNYDKVSSRYKSDPFTTFDQLEMTTETFNIVDTVDLAVSIPFYQLHQMRAKSAQLAGLLDGYTGELNGKTIIFYQQENYTNLADFTDFDGWGYIVPQYDDSFDNGYETYQVVPGLAELTSYAGAPNWSVGGVYNLGEIVKYNGQYYYCIVATGPESEFPVDYFVLIKPNQQENQRIGVWRIVVDETGILILEFDREILYAASTPYSSIRVNLGFQYGGKIISLVPSTILNSTLGTTVYTQPGYLDQSLIESVDSGTSFDENTTQFFGEYTDQYLGLDVGAKYTVFRKQHFIQQGTVDV